jgi:hypothetical protein
MANDRSMEGVAGFPDASKQKEMLDKLNKDIAFKERLAADAKDNDRREDQSLHDTKNVAAGEFLGAEFAVALNDAGVKVTPKQWAKAVATADTLMKDPKFKAAMIPGAEVGMAGMAVGAGMADAGVQITPEQQQKMTQSIKEFEQAARQEMSTVGTQHDHNNITVPKDIPRSNESTSKGR